MVLTPRRVALAAAEALAEGLLGLPVKEHVLAEGSFVARVERRDFRFCVVAYRCSWWWQTLSIVGCRCRRYGRG
jgi:hypothetical protein